MRLKLDLGGGGDSFMIRYVTQGVKLKRYVLLHRGEGVKNDQDWRYVIFGQPLRRRKLCMIMHVEQHICHQWHKSKSNLIIFAN